MKWIRKAKGIWARRVEAALLSLLLQLPNSSVCALTSCLICRSTDEWVQLQVSIPQGQEVGWAGPCGMGYGMQAEGTLPAPLAICAGGAMGT